MALEELATEVIEELDKCAQEVIEYCRSNGLDQKQLYDMVMKEGEHPFKREFLSIGFSTAIHPLGVGVDVSYSFSEMLGERGLERNRVKHFNYSNDPNKRPTSEKSWQLAGRIHEKLEALGTLRSDEEGSRIYETSSGIYLLARRFGNPFGNYKFEPHFELSKKIVIG